MPDRVVVEAGTVPLGVIDLQLPRRRQQHLLVADQRRVRQAVEHVGDAAGVEALDDAGPFRVAGRVVA